MSWIDRIMSHAMHIPTLDTSYSDLLPAYLAPNLLREFLTLISCTYHILVIRLVPSPAGDFYTRMFKC